MSGKDKPYFRMSAAATPEQKKSSAPLLSFCPHCNKPTVTGFGLMGGGYGPYVYCLDEECDYFAKLQVED